MDLRLVQNNSTGARNYHTSASSNPSGQHNTPRQPERKGLSRLKPRSLAVRITLIAFALVLVNSLVLGGISYFLFRDESTEMYAEQAKNVAQSLSVLFDGDHLEQTTATMEMDDQYVQTKALLDEAKARSDIHYIYVLDRNGVFYMQGIAPTDSVGLHFLGDTEPRDAFPAEMFSTLNDGTARITEDVYESEGFGKMVSAYEPIRNSAGRVVGVLGVDISADHINVTIRAFLVRIGLTGAAFCLLAGLLVRRLIRKSVGKPIKELTEASLHLAEGKTDVDVRSLAGEDEIGRLAASFQQMVQSTQYQVSILQAIADGDLSLDVQVRSDEDAMGIAIRNTLASLNQMFTEILNTASQVDIGAHQISDGAQQLAAGNTQQAASIQDLSHTINEIAQQTDANAEMAKRADHFTTEIQASAEEGSRQMARMIQAVREISEANQSIEKVINAIDGIAFQTNILALNASVEAARAGQHGKGFAVVANEVRTLAGKSAEAAKETGALIANSIEKANLGANISGEAAASLQEIVDRIGQGQQLLKDISQSAEGQNASIQYIHTGIDQVSQVVHQNSATSEQSAASSEEMSAQASQLKGLVSRFRLRDNGYNPPSQAAEPPVSLPTDNNTAHDLPATGFLLDDLDDFPILT